MKKTVLEESPYTTSFGWDWMGAVVEGPDKPGYVHLYEEEKAKQAIDEKGQTFHRIIPS